MFIFTRGDVNYEAGRHKKLAVDLAHYSNSGDRFEPLNPDAVVRAVALEGVFYLVFSGLAKERSRKQGQSAGGYLAAGVVLTCPGKSSLQTPDSLDGLHSSY